MNTEPFRNTLLQRLQGASPVWRDQLERVHLAPGPWWAEPDHVYFLQEGLIGLSSTAALAMPAVLGRHACWLNPQEVAPGAHLQASLQTPSQAHQPVRLQAHVLVAGAAHRIRWSALENAPAQAHAWLLQTALASQQLLQQMAQMAYCAQHHAPAQRLASWLLICLHQADAPALQIPAASVLQALVTRADEGLASVHDLQAQGALVLSEAEGAPSVLQQFQADKLAALACNCYRRVALHPAV